MEFGITNKGFVKKTFHNIMDEMIADAKSAEKFGEDFDMRQGTPQYQLFAVFANQMANLWECAEEDYHCAYKDSAEGLPLDYLVKYAGIRRREAIKSGQTEICKAKFEGENGIGIPKHFIVCTKDGIEFETIESGVIENNFVELKIQALIVGKKGNVASNSITEIRNPLAGVDSVTNPNQIQGGKEKETDLELKQRYDKSLAKGGGSTCNAIRSELLNLKGVKDVIVRENIQLVEVNGLPPKSINAVVLGGLDNDIFDAIYKSKAGGIQSFGNITKDFIDDNNNKITIGFDRQNNISVWIKILLTTNNNFSIDGKEKVKNLIIEHITKLGIGEDVISFELMTTIGSKINGVTNVSIESSVDGQNFEKADITIDNLCKAVTDDTRVVVV